MPRAQQHDGTDRAEIATSRDSRQNSISAPRFVSQPDLAEAQNNLGNLLARRKAYAEAAFHFEKAIRSNPNYVEARHSYGVVLALTRAYRPVRRRNCAMLFGWRRGLARAHLDLADVLAAMGPYG